MSCKVNSTISLLPKNPTLPFWNIVRTKTSHALKCKTFRIQIPFFAEIPQECKTVKHLSRMAANDCHRFGASNNDLAKITCDNSKSPDLDDHSYCRHLSCLTVLRPCFLLPARAVCELRAVGRPGAIAAEGKIAGRPERTVDEVPFSGTRSCERNKLDKQASPGNMRDSIPVKKPMSEANSLAGSQGLKGTLMSAGGVTVFSLKADWSD